MIKAMRPDSRNDLLTVSGVSYYTHANTHTFIYNLLHMRAQTQIVALINIEEKQYIERKHTEKKSALTALYFSHISVCTSCPSSDHSPHLRCRDKFKQRLLQGPGGVTYPKLAQHVGHFSSHLFSVTVASRSSTALRSKHTQERAFF